MPDQKRDYRELAVQQEASDPYTSRRFDLNSRVFLMFASPNTVPASPKLMYNKKCESSTCWRLPGKV